jgi:hypothetical protein
LPGNWGRFPGDVVCVVRGIVIHPVHGAAGR